MDSDEEEIYYVRSSDSARQEYVPVLALDEKGAAGKFKSYYCVRPGEIIFVKKDPDSWTVDKSYSVVIVDRDSTTLREKK